MIDDILNECGGNSNESGHQRATNTNGPEKFLCHQHNLM